MLSLSPMIAWKEWRRLKQLVNSTDGTFIARGWLHTHDGDLLVMTVEYFTRYHSSKKNLHRMRLRLRARYHS